MSNQNGPRNAGLIMWCRVTVDRLQDPYYGRKADIQAVQVDDLAARVALIAPTRVIAAWEELRKAWDHLAWEISENMPGVGAGEEPLPTSDAEGKRCWPRPSRSPVKATRQR